MSDERACGCYSVVDRQHFFVNNRPVDMPKLSRAINEVYRLVHAIAVSSVSFALLYGTAIRLRSLWFRSCRCKYAKCLALKSHVLNWSRAFSSFNHHASYPVVILNFSMATQVTSCCVVCSASLLVCCGFASSVLWYASSTLFICLCYFN